MSSNRWVTIERELLLQPCDYLHSITHNSTRITWLRHETLFNVSVVLTAKIIISWSHFPTSVRWNKAFSNIVSLSPAVVLSVFGHTWLSVCYSVLISPLGVASNTAWLNKWRNLLVLFSSTWPQILVGTLDKWALVLLVCRETRLLGGILLPMNHSIQFSGLVESVCMFYTWGFTFALMLKHVTRCFLFSFVFAHRLRHVDLWFVSFTALSGLSHNRVHHNHKRKSLVWRK